MIEEPPLLTIRRAFPRPSAAEIAALTGVPTGFLVDAMDGRGALDGAIKPLTGKDFCGPALPCHAGPDDVLATFATLSVALAGDVVVCASEGFTRAAVTGDLLIGMMKNRGVAALVTDGFVRDIAGIREVGLPCYAAGITPNSPVRNGPGTVGLPVVVGGVAVDAGDIVVGDENGVVVVPRARIAATIARLPAIKAAEAAMEARVKAGLDRPDFWQELIDGGRVRYIDEP